MARVVGWQDEFVAGGSSIAVAADGTTATTRLRLRDAQEPARGPPPLLSTPRPVGAARWRRVLFVVPLATFRYTYARC
ncbi:MAG: hypothetical protein EXR72_16670 [Myxococcales bacterium]|nr:hypothetical protein [Myxococcales bacterium]